MDIIGIWYTITLLGTPEFWGAAAVGLLALYLVLRRLIPENQKWKKSKPAFRKFLLVFLPSITIIFAVTLGIKTLWYIPRPCTPCLAAASPGCNPFCDTDSSFPSGNAGTTFVVFSSFYVAFRRRLAIPLFIIPVLVSYSRIALGVHTWIDVLAGAFLGLAMPVLVSIIVQKKHKSP
jgi:membrane-associated phospholipid phosphatase